MLSAKEILSNNVNVKKNKKNNDNVNKYISNNDNVSSKHKRVEYIANNLVTKLNSPNSYKLFCKVAYKNEQTIIDRCVGLTLESPSVRNKGGYFITLIKEYGEL